MSIFLKLFAAFVGFYMIDAVMTTMKQKKMSAGQSMLWLLSGIVCIVLGVFPSIITWTAELLNISWPPALAIVIAVVILGIISYNHAKEISVLRAQVTELTEQISVMKYELTEDEILKRGSREN